MDVIGHRGAAAVAPENTIEGIGAAIGAGAWGVEVDVRLTSDGRLVLLHDPTVERTTDGRGAVAALTAGEVQALDAGYGFQTSDGARPFAGRGVRVPFLEQAWEAASGRMVLEVKGSWGSDEALQTAEVLASFLDDRDSSGAVVSAFDLRAVALLRGIDATITTGVLTAAAFDARSNIAAAVEGAHDVCFLPEAVTDAAAIAEAHAAGKRIVPWTVNDAHRVRELAAAGADGIITDDPAAAISVLNHA